MKNVCEAKAQRIYRGLALPPVSTPNFDTHGLKLQITFENLDSTLKIHNLKSITQIKKFPPTNLFLILLTTLPENSSSRFEIMSFVASGESTLL